ncbi:hypothetical protein Q8A73_004210 [Channa argus]|nr:hypothetical protein Q8A73_004210 [Channa argus]
MRNVTLETYCSPRHKLIHGAALSASDTEARRPAVIKRLNVRFESVDWSFPQALAFCFISSCGLTHGCRSYSRRLTTDKTRGACKSCVKSACAACDASGQC